MKLLILDDDAQIREGIRKGIDWASLGFDEVRSAGDGISGLEIAKEMTPDIVLSDVRMPGIDGLEFLRRVKEIYPWIKVALISGYDDFEYLQKAIQYGADYYELKPIKMRKLFRLIDDLKARIRSERQPQGGGDDSTQSMNAVLAEKLKVNESQEPGIFDQGRMRGAIEYIKSHLNEDLNVRTLASLLRISPNYFSSYFKKETGISFSRYVNNVRIEAAVYLLENTDQRIGEIATHTGFHNSIYFSQIFREHKGCSPSGYRNTFWHTGKKPGETDHE